jgi:hypothetical protein
MRTSPPVGQTTSRPTRVETSQDSGARPIELRDLWALSDQNLLNALVPASSFETGEHYASPWLLVQVRLALTFPMLTHEERVRIAEARLAAEELRIGSERLYDQLTPAESESLGRELEILRSEYGRAMAPVEQIIKAKRVTEEQESLLREELAVPPKPGPSESGAN